MNLLKTRPSLSKALLILLSTNLLVGPLGDESHSFQCTIHIKFKSVNHLYTIVKWESKNGWDVLFCWWEEYGGKLDKLLFYSHRVSLIMTHIPHVAVLSLSVSLYISLSRCNVAVRVQTNIKRKRVS